MSNRSPKAFRCIGRGGSRQLSPDRFSLMRQVELIMDAQSAPDALAESTQESPRSGTDSRRGAQLKLRAIIHQAAITTVSVSLALAAWAVFAHYFAFPDLVPSPWETLGTGAQMLGSGALLAHIGISLERVLVGYAAGCVLGIL